MDLFWAIKWLTNGGAPVVVELAQARDLIGELLSKVGGFAGIFGEVVKMGAQTHVNLLEVGRVLRAVLINRDHEFPVAGAYRPLPT